MDRLFTVYDDTAVPEDMKDIKNDICRCYIKHVSTFEMNKQPAPLEDLKVSIRILICWCTLSCMACIHELCILL